MTGVGAIAVLALASRFGLATIGALLALVIPALVLWALGDDTVARVADASPIPAGVPSPALPDLGALSFGLVTGAAAVAAIVLVQGAGVRESAPNPGGEPSSVDRDFLAQGAGNIASGLFRGLPVGGSVGQTALNVAAGARSRWANVFSGLWMLVILAALSGLVGEVLVPTLAGVLIFAAVGSLRTHQIATVARASNQSAVALVATFVATLLLPVAVAVGIGVVLSLLLQLNREAVDLRVVRLARLPDGRLEEGPAPARLDEPRGDAARGLRQPAVRRRADAAVPPARPGGQRARRGGHPPPGPRPARRHVRGRRRGLRPAPAGRRRPPVPQRARPRPGGPARADGHPPRLGVPGDGDRRRVDGGGLRGGRPQWVASAQQSCEARSCEPSLLPSTTRTSVSPSKRASSSRSLCSSAQSVPTRVAASRQFESCTVRYVTTASAATTRTPAIATTEYTGRLWKPGSTVRPWRTRSAPNSRAPTTTIASTLVRNRIIAPSDPLQSPSTAVTPTTASGGTSEMAIATPGRMSPMSRRATANEPASPVVTSPRRGDAIHLAGRHPRPELRTR